MLFEVHSFSTDVVSKATQPAVNFHLNIIIHYRAEENVLFFTKLYFLFRKDSLVCFMICFPITICGRNDLAALTCKY